MTWHTHQSNLYWELWISVFISGRGMQFMEILEFKEGKFFVGR